MSQRQGWPQFFAGWLQLVNTDARRSLNCLVVIKRDRRRHQVVIRLNRPSFRSSRWYWRRRWASQPDVHRAAWSLTALSLLATCLLGLAWLSAPFSGVDLFSTNTVSQTSVADSSQPLLKPALKNSLPVKLTIPALKLQTNLIRLGRLSDGTMATPSDPAVAGWYKYSPSPGQIGPAVIAGHVDSQAGPAVFFNLRKLKPGQSISVYRKDGQRVSFIVYRLANYSQRNFPTRIVYGNTPGPELRLITCGGPFNYLTGHYTQNTVVFAAVRR